MCYLGMVVEVVAGTYAATKEGLRLDRERLAKLSPEEFEREMRRREVAAQQRQADAAVEAARRPPQRDRGPLAFLLGMIFGTIID